MANWKRLTSPSGDTIYLNLDVMIGMQRNPDINITFLQSVSEPSVKIEVRETPDEILSLRATYRCDLTGSAAWRYSPQSARFILGKQLGR